MTTPPIPSLPPQGNTNWYAHYAALDATARKLIEDLKVAYASIPTDAGGNIKPGVGSTYLQTSPDGSVWKHSLNNSGVQSWTKVDASNPVPGGDPNPGTDPTLIYTLATIGANTRTINGVNVYRDTNHLTLYTYAATSTGAFGPGPSTPTNMYGVEVVVSGTGASGTVTSVNNRIAASNQATTAIPSGSRVLSGHGQGSGTSGQWLLDHATVGATVGFSAPSATPNPPPTNPATGSLPTHVVSVWHQRWSGPALRDYPTDVKAEYNHYVLGLAQSANPNTGLIEYSSLNGQSDANHAIDIKALVAAGKNVCLGFGGSDAAIQVTNNTQADQLVSSVISLQNTFGFNGIDVDIEPSGTAAWNEQALLRACTALKARFGNGFIIGLTPGLYGTYTDKWLSAARLLGSKYDYMAPMLYDFPEAGDSRLTAIAIDKVDTMVAGGVPISKCMLGFMMRPFSSYTNATPTTSIVNNAYNAVKAKYPAIRGVFMFDDSIEASGGFSGVQWQFARSVGPVVNP